LLGAYASAAVICAASLAVGQAILSLSRRRGFTWLSGPLGLAALLVAGFVQSIAMISMAATLLAEADVSFRARVMGVRMLAVYGLPLGLLAAGVVIPRLGYPATIALSAAAGLVVTVLIGMRWRSAVWRPR
jgi:hypothetical protein